MQQNSIATNSLWGHQIRNVAAVVAKYYGVDAALLYQPRIPLELVRVRRVVAYLLRMHYGHITLRTINEHFGGKRHSAKCSNDIKFLSRELEVDTRLREDIQQLHAQLINQEHHHD